MDHFVVNWLAEGDPELKRAVTEHRRRKLAVATGGRRSRNHPEPPDPVPTPTGDAGTTREVVGRTVLASVEGELAALVAYGDPGPRLRSVERGLCGVVPGTPVIR